MAKHIYGYRKDRPDDRDFKFITPQAMALPPSVDLRKQCSPVRDQGQLGSCTSFSLATGLREFLEKKNRSIVWQFFANLFRFATLSPMFIYYQARALEGTVNEDAGCEIRDGMKVLASMGVCTEANDRYIISKFTNPPTKAAVTNALKYKITSYHRVNDLIGIKQALVAGYGVALGFDVYASFESDAVAATGYMPMPAKGEEYLGGHAVFCVGYVDTSKAPGGGWLIIKNSWGAGWGDKGFFYLPYEYVTPANVGDMWTAIK